MRKDKHSLILLVLVVTIQQGCTSPKGTVSWPPEPLDYIYWKNPIDEKVRENLGTLGVFATHNPPKLYLEVPPTAIENANIKADSVMPPDVNYGPVAVLLLVCLFTVPPLAYIYGLLMAPDIEEVKKADSIIKQTLNEAEYQQHLASYVVSFGLKETNLQLSMVDNKCQKHGNESAQSFFKSSRFDTALITNIEHVGLVKSSPDSLLRLFLIARTDLIRCSDHKVLDTSYLESQSNSKLSFFDWSQGNGKLLRDELKNGFQVLAKKIIRNLSGHQQIKLHNFGSNNH